MDFNKAVKVVKELEGGETVVNHPKDPGGVTKFGISARAFPNLGAEGVRNLTEEQASGIYHEHYWKRVRADELPDPLKLAMFDSAVNQGVGRASKLLQESLCKLGKKVGIDGIIGKDTLAAAASVSAGALADTFIKKRLEHYQGLQNYDTFGRGWQNRVITISLQTTF